VAMIAKRWLWRRASSYLKERIGLGTLSSCRGVEGRELLTRYFQPVLVCLLGTAQKVFHAVPLRIRLKQRMPPMDK